MSKLYSTNIQKVMSEKTKTTLSYSAKKNLSTSSILTLIIMLTMMVWSNSVWAEFRNFEMILNNQSGTLIEAGERTQGTAVSFGFTVAIDGTVTRVAADDPSSVGTVTGKYHSDHGMNNFQLVLKDVDCPVKITYGTCSYGSSTLKVNGNAIAAKFDGDGKNDCWKNNTSNVKSGVYAGNETTLTITVGDYVPYIKVEKVLPYFNVDMTVAEPVLPSAVNTIKYPDVGSNHNGSQHGWQGYAVQAPVLGVTDIYIGGCKHINVNYKAYITDHTGTKIADLDNKAVGCGSVAHYRYEGDADILNVYCGHYSPSLRVAKFEDHDFTAVWDWKTMPTEYNFTLQSSSRWLSSSEPGISLYVGAADGKYSANGDNVQLTNNTKLVIPVYSIKDKICVEGYSGKTHISIHNTEYTSDIDDLPVTAEDVAQGYIEITSTDDNGFLKSVTLKHTVPPTVLPHFVALWKWNPSTPSSLEGQSYSNTTGDMPSTVDGIAIKSATSVAATDNEDNLKLENGTELQIPVSSVGDLIEIYFHSHNQTWQYTKINDGAALTSQKEYYIATAEDVTRGYVKLSATATVYIYHIQLTHNPITAFEDITFDNLDQLISKDTQYYIDATADPVYSTEVPTKGYYNAILSASAVGNGHGLQGTSMQIPLPSVGTYTLILGGCKYSNGTISIKAINTTVKDGEIAAAKTSDCYNGNKGTFIKRSFKVTEGTDWLTINSGGSVYLPYFSLTYSDKMADESDLAVVSATKNIERYTSATLVKGTDYTTSSDGAITFTSSDPSVASVDAEGRIMALNEGTTVITIAQAETDAYLEGSVQITVTVTASTAGSGHALTLGQDIAKLTGTNGNWASTVTYPMTFAVQGKSFGDGDGSNEGTHVNISEVGSIYFDVTNINNNNGGLALRTWIWDGAVKTLYPHALADYATSNADTWLAEYKIQTPGVYRVNVNAFDHLKGVKAANNWGADPLTVDFAFTEGLDNSEGTQYTLQSSCLATGDANTIPVGWTVYSDGQERPGGTNHGSGGRIFDSKDGKGVYTRAAGGEGSVKTSTMSIPAGNVELRALLAYWSNPSDVTIEVYDASNNVVATKKVTTGGAAEASRNNADFKFPEVPLRFKAAGGNYYVKYTLNTEGYAGMFVGGQKVYTYQEPQAGQQTGPSFASAEQGTEYIFIAHDYGTAYQWYDANNEGLSGATPIAGATKPYIRYTASEYGHHYIYCMVTSSLALGEGSGVRLRTGYAHVNVPMPPVRFTKDLDATYEVTVGNSQTLTVEAVAGLETPNYQWYVNYRNDNPDEATPVEGATTASYTYKSSEAGSAWVFCKATHGATSEISTVAKVTATEFVFKNFELDLRNKRLGDGTVTKYIVIPDNGPMEIKDSEPGKYNAKIEATYQTDQHGYQNFTATVPVTGPVAITMGGCAYNNGSNTFTITTKEGLVINGTVPNGNSGTPKVCYGDGDDAKHVGTAYYTVQSPTILTIKGAAYNPYFEIHALTSAVKAPVASVSQAVGTTTVTLSCETDGAIIYYKVGDGEKQTYTAPIEQTANCTITYWAEKKAMANSPEQTCDVKIIGDNAVAYVYDSKYSTYCGLEKDPLYKALKENTRDWSLEAFDMNGMGAEDVTKLDAYSALVISEAQSGSSAFGIKLKDFLGNKPMVSMKTFFMGNGSAMDRWEIGSAFNPSHDGKGISTIKATETYKHTALFEGMLFDGTETNLFNTDAEEYVKANHMQGVKEFKDGVTGIIPLATVKGADGTDYTAVFAKGNNFINIGISCDNIQELNKNGIRLVSNALKLVMTNDKDWTTPATDGSIITGITYAGGKVDATYMGALSNGELAIQKATPSSISVVAQDGSTISNNQNGDIFTFTFDNKEYKVGFSDAAVKSITIGGHTLEKWDGTASTLDIPRTGDLVITFNKAMEANPIVTINGKKFVGTTVPDASPAGSAFTFRYLLDYSTRYNVNVLPPTFRTATGVAFITPIRFNVQTEAAAAITKAGFNFIVDTNLPKDYDFKGMAHGSINAAIEAANAAETSAANRFRIFVPNGTYQVKDGEGATDANGKTKLTKSYVSIIGQDMDKTIIVNKPTTEGLENTATLELNGTLDVYLQDITFKNNYKDMVMQSSNMRAIALSPYNAKGTILKNVKLWSNQDTYYSKGHNAVDYNTYFETSTITGTVDFICGHGNTWFEQCDIVLNNPKNVGGIYIFAPSSYADNHFGMVFNSCTIDKAAGATKVSDNNWWLGRPWPQDNNQDGEMDNEPRATLLNTIYKVQPYSAGWTNWNGDTYSGKIPLHLAEYGSKDKDGKAIDLSGRVKITDAKDGSTGPVLTPAEASQITIEGMFGSNDPRIHTTQVKAPVIGLQSAKVIGWDDINDALCYFVFVDDKLVSIQTERTYNVDRNGTYTVRAANARGGLGAVSNTIRFTTDIPTAWTFGKEAWRSVSTDYWTPGTENKMVGEEVIETLNYQSLNYAFDGITDAENGGQLMENASVFLQTTNGLRFIVNNPTGDQLRYYSPSTKFPKCTGIKANGDNVVVRIPILKGFPVVKITLDGVNKYLLTGATGTTEKKEGDLVPKSDLLGYYNFTVEAGHTLNAVALLKNSQLEEASISQSPIYDPVTRKWTYSVTHNFEYARIKYYTGELTGSTVFNTLTEKPYTITVDGGVSFHVLVEDGQDNPALGPSAVTDVTAPSTDAVFNVNYIPDGVLTNKQDMEDMNLKISKAYSRKASGILHVDGEFLAASANGTVELSNPSTGTLTIEPATFRTDAQGKLDQWFVVYYTGTEEVAQSNATATFKIGGVTQKIKKNGKGEALDAYPFTYQRKVAQDDTATPTLVNNSAVWDWTKKTGDAINWSDPANNEPHRYEFVQVGNVSGMNDDQIGFDASKLITQGQVPYRPETRGNHFMGDYIGFKTKVNGTLRLTMGTTNPTAERRVIVKVGGNVVTTNYKMDGDEQIWDNQTWHLNTQDKKTLADIPITGVDHENGTDVEITTMLYRPETVDAGVGQGDYIPTNEPRPQYFWMYKMEFIADAVEPEIIVNDGTDSKPSNWKVTLDTGDDDDYIYYTLDGSEPTTASFRYSGPFDLPTNYTIKAKTLTPGKKASGVSEKVCEYQLRHLTVKVPSGHGVINPTPLVESGNYIEGFKVELAPKAKMGYVFDKFTSDDKGESPLELTDNLYTIGDADEQTVYAWFTNAPERKTTFMLADDAQKTAIESAGGEATGFTGEGLTLDYFAVPEDYTMYYPGHTLDYWYLSTETGVADADKTKYYPGYASAEEGDALTLYPHFKENSTTNYETFAYRTRNVSAHWDLRTAFGAQPMQVDRDVEKIKLTTHINVINDVMEDVPLTITTKGGRVNNKIHEDWCSITEGVEIELPSGKGATFRFATAAPLNNETMEGTLIDGHHFDSDYKEMKDDNNVTYYIYTYTTQNSDNHIILRIGDDYGYYKYIEADLPPADRAELTTSVNNKNMGQVKITVKSEEKDAEGTEVNREEANRLVATMYPRGSKVTLTAERARYYQLKKWQAISEDGKDTLDITDNMHYRDITFRIDGDNLTFDLMNYIHVRAVYEPKADYYVNFSAGKFASGLPPQQIHNELGEKFQMPKANQTLYYDGHTLKYWEDAKGNRYDFGQQYELNENIVLYPVFEVNKYTLFDLGIDLENKHTDEVTVTWNLIRSTEDESKMLVSPYLNYESTRGVLVSQLKFPNHVGEWIDMPLYIDAKTNYGGGRYAKVNNYASATTCQVNDGTIFTVLVSPNVQVRLTAADGRQITTTDIGGWHQGASGEEGYAVESWGGQTVGICYYGTKPTRDITISSDAQYFKNITARYIHGYYEENGVWKDGQHWVPKLNDDCTVDGVAISEDENISLHELKNCKVRYTPQFGSDKMPDVKVTCGANGYVDIIQPTVDNPVAVINLHATQGVLISTYRIDFEIETPEKPVIKSVTVGGKKATFNSGSFNVSGDVAPSGTVQIEFDHTMKETMLTNFGQRMVAHGDTKILSFNYWNLKDGSYTFSADATALVDKYGQSCFGYKADDKDAVQLDKVNIHFNVSHKEHVVTKQLFNYIVDDNLTPEAKENLTAKGIALGDADGAFTAANGADGTDRFYIYAPDGDYKLTGNTMIKPDYTSDGMIPAQGDGSRWDKTDFDNNIKGKDFANGITQITRSNVSLIGESQNSVRLWNLPRIEGISYTSTIAINQGVTDFYCQDMVLENAFPYKASMDVQGSGSGAAGRAVAFWDKGNKTVMKNVSMLSWQDTYFSNNAGDMRSYWEDCKIAGVVDFLCGDGNLWLERCELMLRDRSGNNIVAPRQPRTQKWGYVFNKCLISAEDSKAADSNEGSYTLGRPWAFSPAATFLYTRMAVKPKAVGWNNMNTDDVLRLHEYMSYNEDGETTVDLTGRSLRDCAPVAGSDDPILTDNDAAQYTLAAAMAGNDAVLFDPQARTTQRPAVREFGIDDNTMSWANDDLALCYFVYKSDAENGQYKLITIETLNEFNCEHLGKGWYKVRAANEYGGLGEWSEAIEYKTMDSYNLTLKTVYRDVNNHNVSWSTICLPYNAKVPTPDTQHPATNLKVYAVKSVRDNIVVLRQVSYITAGKGYVIYADLNNSAQENYVFKGSTHSSEQMDGVTSLLTGNPTPNAVSAASIPCYTLSYKPAVSGIGFYKFVGTTLAPYKAYLTVETFKDKQESGAESTPAEAVDVAAKKGIRFIFEDFDDTTPVLQLPAHDTQNPNDAIYDIQGRRTTKGQRVRGDVYIIDGVKQQYK